jgi:hypothetical protein
VHYIGKDFSIRSWEAEPSQLSPLLRDPEVLCSGHKSSPVDPVQSQMNPDFPSHSKWKWYFKYYILVTYFRTKIHLELYYATTSIR